jgi:4-amino-4-deoxy-L-arabinose transferase-like glycosyltransferase
MTFDSLTDGPRAYLILALLALALYLPGISVFPVTDRDEARIAQATRQMVESGDYTNIRFQNLPRNKKPAGIHWLQAAAVLGPGGGDTKAIWAYRLPSALGAMAAILALFALARPVFGRQTAFLGAVILGSAMLTAVEAHIAKTDAFLLFCVIVAQGALMGIYRAGREGARASPALAMAFWGALGVAIMVKGPLLPFIVLLTLAGLWIADQRAGIRANLWAGLRPLPGLALAAAIAAPWFIAVTLGGSDFIAGSVTGDLLPKLLGVQESHGGPPGYYLALAPITFWPGVLLLPFGLIWAWRNRRDPGPRFCLAWLIPAWLAFELIPTKLAHYVLPLYPAAALLAASAAVEGRDWLQGALNRWPARAWLVLWCLVGLALAALTPVAAYFASGAIPPLAWAPTAAAGLVAVVGVAGHIKRQTRMMAAGPALAMVLFLGLTFAAALPAIPQLWPSASLGALVKAHRPPGAPPVAAVGFHEPSLVFALGTATLLTQAEGAARLLAERPGALALIEARREAKFRAALKNLGVTVVSLGTVRGINLSKGKAVSLTLYRAGPARP